MIGDRVRPDKRITRNSGESYYDFDADPRNQLYVQMLRVAGVLKPRYVVIENVYGLRSARSGEETYASTIEKSLAANGYLTDHVMVETENLGIPQKRHRIFIVGWREGEPPINLDPFRRQLVPEKQTSLAEALCGLPAIPAGGGGWILPKPLTPTPGNGSYLTKFHIANQSKILWNHISRYNNELDLELFAALHPGETYRDLKERIGKKPYMRYSFKNFHDKYFKMHPDRPARTIMAHLAKDGNGYIHPFENRTLSVREAARIQSFPDDYVFTGSRGAQYMQIGNAVPPAIGKWLAMALSRALS